MWAVLRKAVGSGLLIASLACAPSASAAAWAPPAQTIYTGSAGFNGSVQENAAAEDRAGNAYAVWRDVHNGTTYVSERPAGGSFPATPQVLSTSSSAGPPQIAVDASGDVIIVWREAGVLQGVQKVPGGSFQPLTLPTTSSPGDPQIAVGGDGSAIIAWQQSNQIMYSLRRPGGSFGAPAGITNSTNDYLFSIAMDAAGDIGVGLITRTGPPGSETYAVYGGYFDRNGSGFNVPSTALDTQTSTSSDPSRSIFNIKVAMSPSGDAIATWTRSCTSSSNQCSPSPPSNNTSALFESIRKAGQVTSFAPGTSLASSTTGSSAFWNPAAAFDGSGNIVVVWALSAGATNEVDQSQAQVSDGMFTSPAPVATAVGGISWTDIGSLASGQIVLVYTTGSSTQQAWGALRPNGPKGTAFGAGMQISAISGSTIVQSGLVLATQGNDAFVDWSLYTTPAVQGVGYSGNPPKITVTAPATATVGQPVSISAGALGIWTPASISSINFGDGSASSSGASATHTYAAPGTYTVTATGTDAAGNTGNGTAQIAVAAPAPGGGPGGGSGGGTGTGGGDTTPPTLRFLKLTPTAFPAARSGPSIARFKTGTTISYRVSEASTTTFKVERAVPGVKRGHRCVKRSRKTRRGKRCTRFVFVPGSFRHSNIAGTNRFHFTGRVGGAALKAGNYRLDATSKDAAGNVGRTVRSQFHIVRQGSRPVTLRPSFT